MANKKTSDLTELAVVAASGDYFVVLDVSDTTDSAEGTLKKISKANLLGGTNVSQVVGTTETQTLTNKTLTAPVISTISNTGTLTLPTSTDTLVGKATTDTLTNKTLTAPKIADSGYIADANGNEQIIFATTASAVNEVKVTNAATGGTPIIEASGETNVHLTVRGKGNGLTKVSILRQDITSNSYKHNSVILTGWGYAASPASRGDNAVTVTFGIEFAAAPIVVVTQVSGKATAPALISDIATDLGADQQILLYILAIGTTSFALRARSVTSDGNAAANLSTVITNYGYSWIAAGEL